MDPNASSDLGRQLTATSGWSSSGAKSSIFEERVPVDPSLLDELDRLDARFADIDAAAAPYPSKSASTLFFRGERPEDRGTEGSANPMKLIRPKMLQDLNYFANRNRLQAPDQYKSDESQVEVRTELQATYKSAVQMFERLYVATLRLMNTKPEKDFGTTELGELVQSAYSDFSKSGLGAGGEADWLLHTAFSILLTNDKRVKPLARYRALQMMTALDLAVLYEYFQSQFGLNFNSSGLNGSILIAVPHTWRPETDRTVGKRGSGAYRNWTLNDKTALIAKALDARDYQGATRMLVANPREAIQIGLDCLLSHSEFALNFFQSASLLRKDTLNEMLGSRATFYLDQQLSFTPTEQVRRGGGIESDPTASFHDIPMDVLETMSQKDLAQLLRLALQELRSAEDLNGQLASRQSSKRPPKNSDPKGYWRALGLDPRALHDLKPDQVRSVIDGAYRNMSRVQHPDVGGNTSAQQLLNEAHENLIDPAFRSDYGTTPGIDFD